MVAVIFGSSCTCNAGRKHQYCLAVPCTLCMLNKDTWGVKKCEGRKSQQLKALISTEAKKFVNESAT